MEANVERGLREWAEGLPPVLVLCVREAAAVADDLYELLKATREQPLWFRAQGQYHTELFYRYYSDERLFYGDVIRATAPEGHAREYVLAAALFDRMRRWPKTRVKRLLTRLTPAEWKKRQRYAVGLVRVHRNAQRRDPFRDDLFARLASKHEDQLARCFRSPAIVYFFRVWVPCCMYYGKTPQQLLRESLEGKSPNRNALTNLLKIDKRITGHPDVDAAIDCDNQQLREARRTKVGLAIKSYPRAMKRRQVKERLAGFIRWLAKGFGVNLSSTRIRKLFDLLARARDPKRGVLRDSDLPIEIETFRKRVNDGAKRWKIVT